MKDNFRTHFYQSPLCLFTIIALSITVAEYLIMFGFRFFFHLSNVTRETIDAALIFAISSPIIYFFVYRPLRFQITEREKAKRNWEVTFDSIKDPLYLHDSEYRIIQANKAYRDIAGMPFKDMIGKPYYEVFPKTGSPLKSCVGALELQEGREEEITISDINKIFRVRFYPLYDANKYYNSIHIFEDITERKRIENELKSLNESLEQRVMERSAAIVKANETLRLEIEEHKRAEEKLRKYEALFSEANDLAYICDRNGNILFVNKIFERLTGHRPEEFMGKSLAPLFDENNLKKATGYYRRTLKGEGPQFELYFKDTGILCEYKNIPSRDEKGNIVGVMGIARDITLHKRMEEQLRTLNESLEQRVEERTIALAKANKELKIKILELKQLGETLIASEEKFRQIVEHINEIFWMRSIDGKEILYVSPAYEKILGRTCKSLYDNPDDWMNAIHPKDLERVKTAFFEVVKHNKYDEEYRIIRTDKSIRWIHERGLPVKNAAGEIYRLAGIAEDVTDRKLAEEEIKKLNSLLLSIRNINMALLKVKDESELFNKISGFLLDTEFIKFAWIGLVENEGSEVKPVAQAGLDHGYLALIKVKLDDPVYGSGPAGAAIKTGEPIFIKDVESDKRYKLPKSELIKRGLVSIASIPLRPEKKVIGILNIYSDRKDAFGEEEIRYLVQVAGDIGIGYKSLILEKKLKQSVEDLRRVY